MDCNLVPKGEDTGWITLNNVVKYRKKNGIVYVEYITQGSSGDYATLPDGYRPPYSLNNCMLNEGGYNVRVYIRKTGECGEVSNAGAGTWVWSYPL